jgi:hypothetical protein
MKPVASEEPGTGSEVVGEEPNTSKLVGSGATSKGVVVTGSTSGVVLGPEIVEVEDTDSVPSVTKGAGSGKVVGRKGSTSEDVELGSGTLLGSKIDDVDGS